MDLIIGAGITGLSYALLKGDSDYLILETENEIGGYCRTTRRNGFVWDYSGHFFTPDGCGEEDSGGSGRPLAVLNDKTHLCH